jgi:hypothetical protein
MAVWCNRQDSNLRSPTWQAGALAATLLMHAIVAYLRLRSSPAHCGDCFLGNLVWLRLTRPLADAPLRLARLLGFEPRLLDSESSLLPIRGLAYDMFGGSKRDRTSTGFYTHHGFQDR